MRQYRLVIILTAFAGLGLAALISAQKPAEEAKPAASPEEAALLATLKSYGDAYRKGDVEKILAFWAADCEFVDDEGAVTKGKEELGKLFTAAMAERKLESFTAKVTSLRILGNLAMVDGTATVTEKDGLPETGGFQSVWTKVNGQWLVTSVRDLPSDAPAVAPEPGAKLEPLERLIGTWVHKEQDTEVTIVCRRASKKAFLLAEQTVKVKGVETLSLTIIIGWDPELETVRSWMFDSAGGFGDGLWGRKGNEWTVDTSAVRADGRSASSLNVWHFVDNNTLEWSATNREIDGEELPDLKAKYVRQPEQK